MLSALALTLCAIDVMSAVRVPLLGTAVNLDPARQLLRLLASLDAQVDDLVIIHGQDDAVANTEVQFALRQKNTVAARVTVLRYPGYLGCAEAWNAVFTQVPTVPWGIFASSDTAFLPGALEMFAKNFGPLAQPGAAVAAGVTWTNPGMGPGGYNVFALSRGALERCGLFDENIWPAYFEDREMFNLRQSACNLRTIVFDNVLMVHGETGVKPSSGVLKLRKDPVYDAILSRAKLSSWNYISAKWGCGDHAIKHKSNFCRHTTLRRPLYISPSRRAQRNATSYSWELDVGARIALLEEVAPMASNATLLEWTLRELRELDNRKEHAGKVLGVRMACITSRPAMPPGPSFAAALIDFPFNLTAASVRHTPCDNVATAATPAHVYHSL